MTLILTVIFIMCMFLWLLAVLPFPQTAPFSWAHPILAWIAVAILGYVIFADGGGGLRRVGEVFHQLVTINAG
jgi:hypothetical protein